MREERGERREEREERREEKKGDKKRKIVQINKNNTDIN